VHFGIEYEWREVDILAGDTHTPEFLAMNANGKIPLLVLPDGQRVAARPGHIKMQAMAGA